MKLFSLSLLACCALTCILAGCSQTPQEAKKDSGNDITKNNKPTPPPPPPPPPAKLPPPPQS